MEERIQQCNVEIDRLQRDLFKTQEDLRRSESTIDAQLEIEAKMIEEKASLFICAIGIPPRHIVEKLHKAGIPVMNMVGHPHHADRALDVGVDVS